MNHSDIEGFVSTLNDISNWHDFSVAFGLKTARVRYNNNVVALIDLRTGNVYNLKGRRVCNVSDTKNEITKMNIVPNLIRS